MDSGSVMQMAAATARESPPRNGRTPVSISYITTPSDQMSVRASTGSAHVCSGLMYAAVPGVTPGAVIAVPSSLAMPKSRILSVPSAVTMRFAGLMSRWMIPRSCAAASPLAVCSASDTTSSMENGPRVSLAAIVSP